jgi:drug/metabolite transporter (DMT)-like permease
MLNFLRVIVGYTGPLSPTPLAAGLPALRATGWMIASIASFVLMTVAARQLTGHMGTFEILFLRSLVALAILLALRPRLGAGAFATRRLGLHVARNLVHFCGQYAWVWGIAITPLAVVTAIEFTTPVWAALLAALLLGERLSPPRWTAIAGGVTGILVIAHPGTSAFGRGALIVLGGAFCFAAAVLVVKVLLRTDRVTTVVFYMSLIQLPLGLVGTLFAWAWPAPSDLPFIFAMGVTSLTAHYSMGRALSLCDASFVLPIDFLRLPFIALVALLLYGERVDGWTMLGAVLIFAGNYWSVRAETRAAAPPLLGVTSSIRR